MSDTYKDRDRRSRIPSKFKYLRRRSRRAKEKNCLRNSKEIILFRKSDETEYW